MQTGVDRYMRADDAERRPSVQRPIVIFVGQSIFIFVDVSSLKRSECRLADWKRASVLALRLPWEGKVG